MEDLELVWRIKKGDQKAFDALFHKYNKQWCHFTYFYLSDKELVKEVVSDVFLKVWIKRDFIKIKNNLKSYLYTITKNLASDQLGKNKIGFSELTPQNVQDHRTKNSPEKVLMFKEVNTKINGTIGDLPLQTFHQVTSKLKVQTEDAFWSWEEGSSENVILSNVSPVTKIKVMKEGVKIRLIFNYSNGRITGVGEYGVTLNKISP